jgi:F0F1-type ATP synthase membrane subunit b/b'
MLSLDANVVVVFAVVWILVFILTKLFFNPVRRVRDRRESGLAADRKARQQALEGYEKSLAEIESALKDAKAAAEAARARLEQDALKEKNQLLAEVSAECRQQVEQARADLERTTRDLQGNLAQEAAILAEQIEKKLLN